MEDSIRPIILKNLFGPAADCDALDWRPFRAGIDIFRIYGNARIGPSAALLRYAPGSKLPYHSHTGYEHIVILSGSQVDENGHHKEGTVVVNPPATGHSVFSEAGCIVLAIWEHPVIFPGISIEPDAEVVALTGE